MVPLLLSGVLLTACSGGSSNEADPGGASPTSAKDRGLAFAKCMRENGVAKFPDPGSDGSQIVGKSSGIDPKSPEFKKAMEACKDLSPQAEGQKDGKPADLAKSRVWAKCIRDHGVPEFPDPEIDGNTAVVDMTGVPNDEGAPLDKALEDCQDKRPSGNLQMRSNGGGQ
ncbi:hypothetical protein ACQP1W_31285 [Spirillospora sp. CA-255316]